MQLLTIRNAAARLDVHQDTVRRLVDRGVLTKHVIGTRAVRVDAVELEGYARRGQLAPEEKSASAGQISAFNAKCGELARLRESTKADEKRAALLATEDRTGCEIDSFTDLTYGQASETLDELERLVEEAKA